MRFKYVLIVVAISLLFSCKSKKKAISKSTPKKVVVNNSTQKSIKTMQSSNSPITNATLAYIKRYSNTAMESMRIYKIPASITLAQGILESSSGRSELTIKSNNHFGIKCHKGWKGKRVYHDDDIKDDCFRVYKNPSNSFKDHSLFLTSRSRYAKLFKLKQGDYVAWAKGLSEAGYATDRRYPAKLIALIEKYNLHKFDTQVLGTPAKVQKVKNTISYVVRKGDTLYSISKKYGLTVEELKRLNGLQSNNIKIGQQLFLQ
jgi:flagellum-specific peptidoglycan hydrolase FlgJ